MKEHKITSADEGRRLDKYIQRILSNAPSSFAYKMLRKKNIVLNDKKASGNEFLKAGDIVRFYLADETFDKFSDNKDTYGDISHLMPPVIYEDDDILIVDKPSGMLTQKSSANDISLNEICLSYTILKNGTGDFTGGFTPSVCNRLDRNTSGLVTFAKTYRAAKCLSEAFRKHSIGKYYKCMALGHIEKDIELSGSLSKDNMANKVKVAKDGSFEKKIITRIHPLKNLDEVSLLEIELITGKTHQIRAHLASCGHPVVGDIKYGDSAINRRYRKLYGIESQMLVCYRMVFPDDLPLEKAAGKTIETDVTDDFYRVLNGNMEFKRS